MKSKELPVFCFIITMLVGVDLAFAPCWTLAACMGSFAGASLDCIRKPAVSLASSALHQVFVETSAHMVQMELVCAGLKSHCQHLPAPSDRFVRID